MDRPKLYGTPLSHFTRKVRIVLAELGVPFDFIRAPDILATVTTTYGDNPLMRVPALVHQGQTVIDSDHIARVLVAQYDPSDRLDVCGARVSTLNQLAVANGIMSNEVVLILAKRGGLTDLDGVAYFRKLAAAIDTGLAWLELHVDPDATDFSYADVATICMWQHVTHYGIAKALDSYPRIAKRVAMFSERPSIATTTPEASLAAAP